MLLKHLVLASSLIFFLGCKKNKGETILSGVVQSEIESISLKDVSVKFYTRSLATNSYSSSFSLIEAKNTLSTGEYNFSFVKTASDIEYKLEFLKESYLFKTILYNPSSIVSGEENKEEIFLIPYADVTFNLKSTATTGASDQIIFTFNNELEEGQSFLNVLLQGQSSDTLLSTQVKAERYNRFSYFLKRNGQFFSVNDSVFISKGQTVLKEIFY